MAKERESTLKEVPSGLPPAVLARLARVSRQRIYQLIELGDLELEWEDPFLVDRDSAIEWLNDREENKKRRHREKEEREQEDATT